jgi:hypothetical protein
VVIIVQLAQLVFLGAYLAVGSAAALLHYTARGFVVHHPPTPASEHYPLEIWDYWCHPPADAAYANTIRTTVSCTYHAPACILLEALAAASWLVLRFLTFKTVQAAHPVPSRVLPPVRARRRLDCVDAPIVLLQAYSEEAPAIAPGQHAN